MCKSEFGRESYGHPKLALLISRGGAEMRAYPPFSLLPRFAQFWDAVLDLDGPGNSYTRSMTVPQQKTDYTMK